MIDSFEETVDSTEMVRMPVTDHNMIDRVRRYTEDTHIVPQHDTGQTNVEQDPAAMPASLHIDKKADSVLGLWRDTRMIEVFDQSVPRYAVITCVDRTRLVRKQHIDPVLYQDRDRDGVCLHNQSTSLEAQVCQRMHSLV
ncbi:hypothetical protein ACIBG0_40840 [Nocardia sp. NPDC050630]|uniref:hypothetical protein n=1 Tax=Nocardia sp. NPDC050630 TaxID=3364321 RepID=UPI0037AF1D9D